MFQAHCNCQISNQMGPTEGRVCCGICCQQSRHKHDSNAVMPVHIRGMEAMVLKTKQSPRPDNG
jgi:hypothetical protein